MMRTAAPSAVLAVVPSLDALADDPTRATTLPLDTARALFQRVALVQALLLGRLMEGASLPPAPPSEREIEEWLSAEQVQARFALPKRWLSDHMRELRSHRIVSRPSRKVVVFHARRFSRFLEAQCS
jgi:hypothetical protein